MTFKCIYNKLINIKYYGFSAEREITSILKMSGIWLSIALVTLCSSVIIAEERHEPHLHSEVKIVGYTGRLNKHILSLFRNAEILELIDCNITSVTSNVYSMMPNLKKIYMKNNFFEGVEYETVLQGAGAIDEVHFINNSVTELPLDKLSHLPHLKKMVIKELQRPLKVIESTTYNDSNLEFFEYSYCGIEKVEDGAFVGLDDLQVLDLSHNKLKTISKEALTPLKSLKSLVLTGNEIEHFGIANLPALPHLEKIHLSKNPLTKLDLEGVDKVAPNLKTVVVKETKLTEAQVKELKEKTKLDIEDKKAE